ARVESRIPRPGVALTEDGFPEGRERDPGIFRSARLGPWASAFPNRRGQHGGWRRPKVGWFDRARTAGERRSPDGPRHPKCLSPAPEVAASLRRSILEWRWSWALRRVPRRPVLHAIGQQTSYPKMRDQASKN